MTVRPCLSNRHVLRIGADPGAPEMNFEGNRPPRSGGAEGRRLRRLPPRGAGSRNDSDAFSSTVRRTPIGKFAEICRNRRAVPLPIASARSASPIAVSRPLRIAASASPRVTSFFAANASSSEPLPRASRRSSRETPRSHAAPSAVDRTICSIVASRPFVGRHSRGAHGSTVGVAGVLFPSAAYAPTRTTETTAETTSASTDRLTGRHPSSRRRRRARREQTLPRSGTGGRRRSSPRARVGSAAHRRRVPTPPCRSRPWSPG